jgi:hypothetical protein
LKGHRPLEDISIFVVIGRGGIGPRDAEHIAQLRDEKLVVGTLRRSGVFPAVDERLGVRVLRRYR